ncbi:MAG: hypothetical protein WEA29_08070 [Acidimicrobiia bacterium]
MADGIRPELVRWARQHPAVSLSIVGIASFAWIGTHHAIYYGLLGVTPSEVGIGYAETLSRGAIGFAVIGILAAACGALALPVIALATKAAVLLRARLPLTGRYLISIALGSPVYMLAVLVGISLWQATSSWFLRSLLALPALVIMTAGNAFSETLSVGPRGVPAGDAEREDHPSDDHRRMQRDALVALGLLLLLLPYASTVGAVFDTRAQRPVPPVFSALTGLRADRVTVTLLTTDKDLFGRPVMLLGGTDQYLVLLESDRSIRRVPPSAVMLATAND